MTRSRWMGLVGWAAGGYAAVLGSAFALQRSFMYPAPKDASEPVVRGGRLHRIAGKTRTVYALHVPAQAGSRTIVHFHGNGESLSDQVVLASELSASGLGFFAVEYPGYGLAREGTPTEESLYEDAEVAIGFLRDSLGVATDDTVLQGTSLGTGVAVEMARRGLGSRLVLIAPFTSMTDMVKKTAPFLPARLIVKDTYDNHSKAPSILVPVLIIHGSDDEIIPVAMGRRLATAFPNAQLYIAPRAHHNDLFVVDGPRILDSIRNFAAEDASSR